MAVAIKAINARIRANPVLDYFCSTHFWGPASNFGIPLAAVMDTQKDPEIISGRMTVSLIGYSSVFMRYAMAVTPKNYLLFGCHAINFSAQSVQAYRFANYWYMGGREKALHAKEQEGLTKGGSLDKAAAETEGAIKEGVSKVESTVKDTAGHAKEQVEKVTR